MKSNSAKIRQYIRHIHELRGMVAGGILAALVMASASALQTYRVGRYFAIAATVLLAACIIGGVVIGLIASLIFSGKLKKQGGSVQEFDNQNFRKLDGSAAFSLSEDWLFYKMQNQMVPMRRDNIASVEKHGDHDDRRKIWMKVNMKDGTSRLLQYENHGVNALDTIRDWLAGSGEAVTGVCPECGQPIEEGAAFCGWCGCRLEEKQELPQRVLPAETVTKSSPSVPVGLIIAVVLIALLLFYLIVL